MPLATNRSLAAAAVCVAPLAPLAAAGNDIDPCAPVFLASIDTQSFIRDVAIDGPRLYMLEDATLDRNGVGQEDTGLLIADVADPFDPIILGSYATLGTATDIAIANGLVYIADGGPGGLLILDTTDPASPFPVGSFDSPGDGLGVDVSGGLAVLADGHAGVHLLSVSNPTSPALVSTLDTQGLASDAIISGSTLYVADGLNGVVVIDITEPALPTIIANIPTQGSARDLALHVAEYEGGLLVANVSDPANPVVRSESLTPGAARAVTVDNGERLYVADLYAGVHRMTITNNSAGIAATRSTPGASVGVAAANGLVYVAENHAGMRILNLQDCTLPCLADFAPLFGTLDLADLTEFIRNFQGESSYNQPGRAAAIAEPTDVADLADIVAFVNAFNDGCR